MFFLVLIATLRLDLAPDFGGVYPTKAECLAALAETQEAYAEQLKTASPALGLKFACLSEVK